MKHVLLGTLCAIVLAFSARAASSVIISEFMAANASTLRDENGDSEDWIEIYNPGNAPVNIGGWYLTDNAGNLRKWQFPATNLAPNQFLIVFASNKDRRVAGTNLHTNFRLNNSGEYLALVEPDGVTIATAFSPAFPPQADDVSYGLPVTATLVPLLARGAPGKFLVPRDGALGTNWIEPAFNDASWSNVNTGVGFDFSGALVFTPIADSYADWSLAGAQGFRRWTYGYYNRTQDLPPIYQTNDFLPFPRSSEAYGPNNFWNGSIYRWPAPANPWTLIGQNIIHPNGVNSGDEHWAMRRWASTTNGTISSTWYLRKIGAGGNGVNGRLFHNGVEMDAATVDGADTVGVTRTVTLTNVQVGDFIDLAMTPYGTAGLPDDGADGSYNGVVHSALGSLTNFVESNVGAQMRGSNATAYLRLPFVVTNVADIDRLLLRMRFDDGFVAYLNGFEIARRNAPVFQTAGTNAHSINDWSATGQQGANGWRYGFYNKTLDADGVYHPNTDFNTTDPQWLWNGSAWVLGPGDPPWTFLGVTAWHPNGDNSGDVQWAIRRWVSGTAGTIAAHVAFAKENPFCGNGTTLRIFHNGAPRFAHTIAWNDSAGINTNVLISDVQPGDVIDFALDSLGTDSSRQDGCDGSTFSVVIDQSPADGLNWNSGATQSRSPNEATQIEEFDITTFRNRLVAGTNLLAFHALNVSSNDADFLLLPEVIATYYTYSPGQRVYFPTPTPGAINGPGTTALGPLVRDVKHTPHVPNDNEDLVVTARLVQTIDPIGGATLKYRVMYGAEFSTPMFDDGAHGDGDASDGVFGGTIPASAAAPGQMLRYYIVASDSTGDQMRSPAFSDPLRSPEYYGTIVADASFSTQLPVLHWFIESPGAADNFSGTRASFFYNGEFHDNIGVNLHGQSSSGFPKKSYDFDLNRGMTLKWSEDAPGIDDFNLITTYGDRSYMREMLAFETYRDADAPSHFSFPVRVQQNGLFFSVAWFVENGDDNFLQRLGLDQNGALYKMYNSAESAGGGEKKTRKNEGSSDLAGLIGGMSQGDLNARLTYMYDNLDVAEMVNFLAAKVITADVDCCHKNYYFYRDSEGTGEWQAFPWDVDLSFGHTWTVQFYYYDDTMFTNSSLYVGNGNIVFTRIFEDPGTKQMYLRRVRTLMDQMMQPPGTAGTNDFYRQKFDSFAGLIGPDAALDFAKWGSWAPPRDLTNELNRMKAEFLPGRRAYLYHTMSVNNGGDIPNAQPPNPTVSIAALDYRPMSGIQDQEWIAITNANSFAVDISGWELDGGVQFRFKGGTVVPALSTLYASPNTKAFRARTVSPKGGEKRLVTGPYSGNLSAWGEGLTITDPAGRLVTSNYFPGTPSLAQQYLRITELMYNPAPLAGNTNDAQAFEYIELKNIGPVALDLRGVRFVDGVEFAFTGSAITNLAPSARALVVRSTNAFAARYGTGLPIAGQYLGALENNGENVRLVDSLGEKILEFDYENDWYPITDGHGFSLVIVNEAAHWSTWDEKSSWRPSGTIHGAPGASDPAAAPMANILVNEALTHTDPPAVDAIELHNPTTNSVNISGWFLSDDFNTPKKFRVPAGSTIAPDSFIVFSETNFNAGGTGFALGSDGDEVWLFSGDANTNLSGYYHGFKFGAAQNGVSFGRHVNSQSEEHFVAQSTNTLGASNALPRVGPVIVSEIMYHPPDAGTNDNAIDEFIELHNITATNVTLFDPTNRLNTWRLRDAVDFNFPTNVILAAGSRLLVVGFQPTNAALLTAFRTTYAVDSNVLVLGPWSGKLDNSSDTIELKRPDSPNGTNVPYILVEEIRYRDALPWPNAADGDGASLQRKAAGSYGNDPTNWFASAPTAGNTNVINQSPSVALTSPASGAVFQSPTSVTLTANASDSDGSITKVEFFNGSTKLGEVASNPYTFVWSNVPPGTHTLTAKARDNRLGTATSSNVVIFVLTQPPVVAVSTPTNGAAYLAGSTITVRASAFSPEVSIAEVDFYAGATHIGSAFGEPFQTPWSNVSTGVHRLTAVAIDSTGRSATSAVIKVAVATGLSSNVSFIASRATWKYRDDGSDQGTNWIAPAFDDSGWSNGPAQLGYGDGDEATIVSYGTNAANKYITTYFRRSFAATNVDQITAMQVRVLRDDGAVVYLNGTEVFRTAMPGGVITFGTLANVTAAGADETNFFSSAVSPSLLVEGINIVAVEVHQSTVNSSDLSFDLEFSGTRTLLAPSIIDPPASRSVPPGSNATFFASTAGTKPLAHQWRFNGTNLLNATNTILVVTNATTEKAGNYLLVVSNAYGVANAVATLTVGDVDSDGDGMTDSAELIAGTNPNDASSFLQLGASILPPNSVVLRFDAVTNRGYSLLWRATPSMGTWTLLTNVPAASTPRTIRVTNSAAEGTNQFYRLVTPQLP